MKMKFCYANAALSWQHLYLHSPESSGFLSWMVNTAHSHLVVFRTSHAGAEHTSLVGHWQRHGRLMTHILKLLVSKAKIWLSPQNDTFDLSLNVKQHHSLANCIQKTLQECSWEQNYGWVGCGPSFFIIQKHWCDIILFYLWVSKHHRLIKVYRNWQFPPWPKCIQTGAGLPLLAQQSIIFIHRPVRSKV